MPNLDDIYMAKFAENPKVLFGEGNFNHVDHS